MLPLLFPITISQLQDTQTSFIRLFLSFHVLRGSSGVEVLSTDWILDSVDANRLLPTRFYLVQGIPPPTFSCSPLSDCAYCRPVLVFMQFCEGYICFWRSKEERSQEGIGI